MEERIGLYLHSLNRRLRILHLESCRVIAQMHFYPMQILHILDPQDQLDGLTGDHLVRSRIQPQHGRGGTLRWLGRPNRQQND